MFLLVKIHMLIIIFVEILYFFFIFVATPGGVQGHVFIGLQSTINHSNHSREIGDPPPHRP